MTKPKQTYQELKSQLDEVMQQLQREDLDIDKAIEYYQKGLELVRDIETYLKTAENKVTEIKAKFNLSDK